MTASQKVRRFSSRSWEQWESEAVEEQVEVGEEEEEEEEERFSVTMFDVRHRRMREKIVLQRLIVIGRLPHHLVDSTDLGAHYEKLNFSLSKRFIWDHMTGLLLVYPSCALHVVESSREVLVSVLRDLKDMQQQPDGPLLENPRVFMENNPQSRLFSQWSYKVLQGDQGFGSRRLGAEEESTETLVCSVLSALQNLGQQTETSKKAAPGSVVDESAELVVPPALLHKLFSRDELLTPQQYLQLYDSPLNINMDFGQAIRSSFLSTV